MHHREVMCEGNKGKSSDANLSRRMWTKSLATFKKKKINHIQKVRINHSTKSGKTVLQ